MNQRPKYLKGIQHDIAKKEKGDAFTAVDFSDIANEDAVNKALSRLCADGEIRRVIQGVYDVPEYSELLQEYAAPRIDKVAEAIARRYNWTIAPSGETALNMLHLSTQVPNVWEYVSDGPYRKYQIGNICLSFKRRANKDTSGKSDITIMVSEALKALGQDRVDDSIIEKIRISLPETDREKLYSESKTMTGWVRENIKKVCEVTDEKDCENE